MCAFSGAAAGQTAACFCRWERKTQSGRCCSLRRDVCMGGNSQEALQATLDAQVVRGEGAEQGRAGGQWGAVHAGGGGQSPEGAEATLDAQVVRGEGAEQGRAVGHGAVHLGGGGGKPRRAEAILDAQVVGGGGGGEGRVRGQAAGWGERASIARHQQQGRYG